MGKLALDMNLFRLRLSSTSIKHSPHNESRRMSFICLQNSASIVQNSSLPVDELIEMADGFAGVFPEHKYESVKRPRDEAHLWHDCDGVNDAPALKRADIGIDVADASDAARSASDIVLTDKGSVS